MRTKIPWVLVISLLSLALGSCRGSSETAAKDSPTPTPADTSMVSPVTPGATSTSDAWKIYHSTEAGYSVEYPADWVVNETTGINGELIAAFMSPDEGQSIAVNVSNSEASVEEIPDMPNTRCQQVTISGSTGRRCFDTLAFSFSTTFMDKGRQYVIASSGKHPDQDIYQHFIDSFKVNP